MSMSNLWTNRHVDDYIFLSTCTTNRGMQIEYPTFTKVRYYMSISVEIELNFNRKYINSSNLLLRKWIGLLILEWVPSWLKAKKIRAKLEKGMRSILEGCEWSMVIHAFRFSENNLIQWPKTCCLVLRMRWDFISHIIHVKFLVLNIPFFHIFYLFITFFFFFSLFSFLLSQLFIK